MPRTSSPGATRPPGTGLAFGRREFAPAAFRVTVASFNERALRVVRSLGFVPRGSFQSLIDARPYELLIRPEPRFARVPLRSGMITDVETG